MEIWSEYNEGRQEDKDNSRLYNYRAQSERPREATEPISRAVKALSYLIREDKINNRKYFFSSSQGNFALR
jgi:hypothetical protein